MNQEQQRKLDSLRRVQDFIDANAGAVGALKDAEGSRQLDNAIAAVSTHAGEQATLDRTLAGGIKQQEALAADLQKKHMQSIAFFARAKLRGVPDFAALEKSGVKLQPKALIRAARAMATAAAPQSDAFVKAGFPADTIAQLGNAATALESTMSDRANAKVRRVSATKGISESLKAGREAVSMLNAVIRRQFAGDATFLAGWRAAHRIQAKQGLVRAVASAVASVVPAPTPPVAPTAA